MRLYNYLEGIEIKHSNICRLDTEISGVTSKTDDVENGYIFVCINGMKVDGHEFACLAKQKGACFLVVEYMSLSVALSGLPYIVVENARKALAQMCAIHRGNPEKQLKLIGVTGTNGKTSTCRLLKEIYCAHGKNAETIGTLDGGLTTPDSERFFEMLREKFDRGVDTVIMEVSSHALALDKLYGVKFHGAIFTNLTPEHLDFHHDMDSYCQAKAKLFKMAKWGLYNVDDEYAEGLMSANDRPSFTYSIYKKSKFKAKDINLLGIDGIEYSLDFGKEQMKIKSSLCGVFNVYNTMASACAGYIDGIDTETIKNAISSVKTVCGRLERVELGNVNFSVYIDYAHTPDALQNVLECVSAFKKEEQRLVVLFGCGGDRDKSKRSVMGKIASSIADLVIVTSDNSRSENPIDIINDIMQGIDKNSNHMVIESREAAIEYAVVNANEGDIILLCGKGHEDYEIGKFTKRYFSEKEIAARAVKKRLKNNDY